MKQSNNSFTYVKLDDIETIRFNGSVRNEKIYWMDAKPEVKGMFGNVVGKARDAGWWTGAFSGVQTVEYILDNYPVIFIESENCFYTKPSVTVTLTNNRSEFSYFESEEEAMNWVENVTIKLREAKLIKLGGQ